MTEPTPLTSIDPVPNAVPNISNTPPTIKAFLLAISSVVIVWVPILALHLVLVFFSAMIMYATTRGIANWLRQHVFDYFNNTSHASAIHTPSTRAEILSVVIILSVMTLLFYVFGDWVADKASVQVFNALAEQVLSIFDQLHTLLPVSLTQHLPASVSAFKALIIGTVKNHAPQLQLVGIHTLRGFGYVLVGTVIGAIAAIQVPATMPQNARPLAVHLRHRFDELMTGFTDVFFAQVRISSINTILTSVYLLGILPAIGHPLPMAWTLVIITFLAGLIPVVGNLFSNIVIVLLSLTHGLGVSIASLVWLVSIHKLEYFLNAQIIGHKIRASAWELLLFMLFLESLFGLAGLVSAPVIYAQIKRILTERQWV